jgi:DNA-binding NarL/FixJ family response regulator
MIDPAVAGVALQDFARGQEPGSVLTERELEVLRSLARGFTNREIGEAIFIGEETVKTPISNILGKLRLMSRTQAVIYTLKPDVMTLLKKGFGFRRVSGG